MKRYAVLIYPSANRVYADTSVRLLCAELQVFDARALGGKLTDLAQEIIGGVTYVTFSAPELTEADVILLSNLSSLYALFELRSESLRPLPIRRLDVFDDDLLTILKYPGKTNELFTKLLLNVTALATDTPRDLVSRRLRVLDPLCGRGTTLNQALMYGFDAAGIDTDGKDFDEYARFIRTWLERKRLKHQASVTRVRRDRTYLGRKLDVSVGVTKQRYQAGDTVKLAFVQADTATCTQFFRAGSFDIVVADAPYGVRHGSRAGSAQLSRGPAALLAAAVPGWASLLRPGGALGISWNTHVGERDELAHILTAAGLEVRNEPSYLDFRHKVDQAIVRDILVAAKPG